jgi:hypothetical protein
VVDAATQQCRAAAFTRLTVARMGAMPISGTTLIRRKPARRRRPRTPDCAAGVAAHTMSAAAGCPAA